MSKYEKLSNDDLTELLLKYSEIHDNLLLSDAKYLCPTLMDELMLMRKEIRKRGLV